MMKLTFEKLQKISNHRIELLGEQNLIEKLAKDQKITVYLGAEASGFLHLGHLIPLKLLDQLSRFQNVEAYFLISKIHAELNQKESSPELILDLAKTVHKFFPSLKIIVSGFENDFPEYHFLELGSSYFKLMMLNSQKLTINRLMKGLPMDYKQESEMKLRNKVCLLQYPLLQITDIAYLEADLAIGGIDQRKYHILATELYGRTLKPSFIHFPLLTDSKGSKISKSLKNYPTLDNLESYFNSFESSLVDKWYQLLIDNSEEKINIDQKIIKLKELIIKMYE